LPDAIHELLRQLLQSIDCSAGFSAADSVG
jgi:hypothetical protein